MANGGPPTDNDHGSHDVLTSTGYDLDLFVEPNKANDFLCVICQLVIKRPKTHYRLPNSAVCKVVFCAECLKTYIRHYNNSPSHSETPQDPSCPFRCGATLIIRGRNRNVGPLPRAIFRRLSNLRMICPYGRGTIRYIDYEEHCQLPNSPCPCQGFIPIERRPLEKRLDSILHKVCVNKHDDDLYLSRCLALMWHDVLYPEN